MPREIRWTALSAVALIACNDQPTAPLPDQLVVTRPPSLVGAPGFPLMDTIFVRVLDAAGNARPGVPVTWGVRDGGGSVLPLTEVSGTDGITAAIWTLGPRQGHNELRVSISEEEAYTFTATGEVFRATKVTGDFYVGCGLVGGAIWCWGRGGVEGPPASDYDSATARPWRSGPYFNSKGPALYDDAREYTDVALGEGFRTCALDAAGGVWCGAPPHDDLPPTQIVGFPPLQSGSLTGSTRGGTCGLAASDGRAWCWRDGSVGIVPGSPSFIALRMEYDGRFFCGLQHDSTAACWGEVPPGNGSAVPSAVPVTVSGGHRFVDLVVGQYFACGRTSSGDLWCWGSDYGTGARWLEPVLTMTGVLLVGATDDRLMVKLRGGQLVRGVGPDFAHPSWDPSPAVEGLEQLPVADFADHGVGCVLGPEDEVYCVREMWDYWTGQNVNGYFPVMPVRQPPPAPAVLR